MDWYTFGVGSFLLGEIGIAVGLAALIANLKRFRANLASREARRWPVLIVVASLLGLVACYLTSFIAFEYPTMEGAVLEYGWPFMVRTTDRYQGDTLLWPALAFWLLVPQILLYVYGRLLSRQPLASGSHQSN